MYPFSHRSSRQATSYQENLSVFSASSFNRQYLNNGNNILLPASTLTKLVYVKITGRMIFKIQSTQNQKFTYVGVLEFVAEEGTCVVPDWLFDNMILFEGCQIIVSLEQSLPSGKMIKIQPHKTAFIALPDPRAILQTSLTNYVCLNQGDTITIPCQNKSYMIDIVKVEPLSEKQAVRINEAELEIDFMEPLDSIEVQPILVQKQEYQQLENVFEDKGFIIDDATKPSIKKQLIVLLFENKQYCLIAPVQNISINELQQQFFQLLQDFKTQIQPETYYCQDLAGNRLLGEMRIWDIIQQAESFTIKFIKTQEMIDVIEQQKLMQNVQIKEKQQIQEKKYILQNNDIKEQKINQEDQSMNDQQRIINQNISGQELDIQNNFSTTAIKLMVTYKNTIFFLDNPYQFAVCKNLKTIIILGLKDYGIVINGNFCELFDESTQLSQDQTININLLKTYRSINLVDQKELQLKYPKIWNQCIGDLIQIQKDYCLSSKVNEKYNLKIAYDSWNQKQKAYFKMFPLSQNLNISKILFIGPKKSPYQDGIYELICKFPEEYPFKAPQLYFLTQIYHPNIVNGKIAFNLLEESWNSTLNFDCIILQIKSLLSEPNLQFVLDEQIGQQYQSNRDTFNQIAQEQNNQFASEKQIDIFTKSVYGESPLQYFQVTESLMQWFTYWVYETN